MTQQRFTVTHFILDTAELHRHSVSSFSGKCRLPLWSEMDMRLLLRCAAPMRGEVGRGEGFLALSHPAWVSPPPRRRCPVCVNCTVVLCITPAGVPSWELPRRHGDQSSHRESRAAWTRIRDTASSHMTHS